jgi:deoxyribonuclease V
MIAHDWDVTPQEAIAIQQQLRQHIITRDDIGQIHWVAGVDVGFKQQGAVARAAIAVLRFPDLTLTEQVMAELPTAFPYVPGLLSFREIPVILKALGRLSRQPDLLLCDGMGIAHPRRVGIATHLGLLTDIPSIGVGKSLLTGKHGSIPVKRGEWTPLLDKGEVIGAVLRTRVGVKPVYISSGHRISLATAISYVMACTTRYRLPETTRYAHRLASLTP